MNKHNCPRCNKELTLNNGQFYCKGENPYHIYYSTPEEAFNGIKYKIESSNIKCFRSSNFIINLREEFHSKFFPDVCIYDTRFIQPCRYFSGRIKNKTELKFILNAIG